MKPTSTIPIRSDAGDLLDAANTLLLTAPLDVPQAALLIGKLRTCANQASMADAAGSIQQLREAADRLEKRLLTS